MQKLRIVESDRIAHFNVNLRAGDHLIGQPLQHPPFHPSARHLLIELHWSVFGLSVFGLFTVLSSFNGGAVDARHIEESLELASVFGINDHHRPVPPGVHRLHIH